MTRSPSLLRNAFALLSVRLVVEQIGLALLVFTLYDLWLHVPDASAIDVTGSALLALITLAVAGTGESILILRLSAQQRTPGRLLRGVLLLLAGTLLWFGWSALLDHMHGDDYLRAGYLNSRFPHSLRNFFSFSHIFLWLGWIWVTLEWIGAGVIAIFVFTATASIRPLRAMLYVLGSVIYWIALLLGTAGATALTGSLMQWTPSRGLRVEMLSLVLRLSIAVLVNAVVVSLLLAILAACVRRSDMLYATPAGTPDESQPRTVESP
jgi:hypothetical protein